MVFFWSGPRCMANCTEPRWKISSETVEDERKDILLVIDVQGAWTLA